MLSSLPRQGLSQEHQQQQQHVLSLLLLFFPPVLSPHISILVLSFSSNVFITILCCLIRAGQEEEGTDSVVVGLSSASATCAA